MGLSSAGESLMLNTFLTGRYVSLHNNDPGDTGANEVIGGAYTRQPATFSQSGNNPTIASNDNVVEYATATGPWGYIYFFGIWSAAIGGTYLGGEAVQTAKDIGTGDTGRWDVGSLIISAD